MEINRQKKSKIIDDTHNILIGAELSMKSTMNEEDIAPIAEAVKRVFL